MTVNTDNKSVDDRQQSIIYALVDPVTGSVRYVGKTTKSLTLRWQQHMSTAKRGMKQHRDSWIRSLITLGEVPHIEQLDSGRWSIEEANKRERYWISRLLTQGAHLTNKTEGGDGNQGIVFTQDTRLRISKAIESHWQDPEYREKTINSHILYWEDNDRARKAVSRQLIRQWSDPNNSRAAALRTEDYRALRSDIAKRISSTEDAKIRLSNNGKISSGKRRICLECGKISHPAGIGTHQKATQHEGFAEVIGNG